MNTPNRLRAAMFLVVFVFCAAVSSAQSSSTAVMAYLEGDVRVNGELADFGTTVPFGALVQTAAESFAEIRFEGANLIRIEPNSVVRVSLNESSRRIDLRRGQVAAIATRIDSFLKPQPRLVLKTPTVVAGVRGTLFIVRVEDPSSVYVCTCLGRLSLTGEEFDGVNIDAVHHEALRFRRNTSGVVNITEAPLLYHDDESMEKIAAKIGITPEWGVPR